MGSLVEIAQLMNLKGPVLPNLKKRSKTRENSKPYDCGDRAPYDCGDRKPIATIQAAYDCGD
jgi:hypothetical protein